jgi:hypothetical protein
MLVGLSKRERQDPAIGHLSLPQVMRSTSENAVASFVCLVIYRRLKGSTHHPGRLKLLTGSDRLRSSGDLPGRLLGNLPSSRWRATGGFSVVGVEAVAEGARDLAAACSADPHG